MVEDMGCAGIEGKNNGRNHTLYHTLYTVNIYP